MLLKKPCGAAAHDGGAEPPPWPGCREAGPTLGETFGEGGDESSFEVEDGRGGRDFASALVMELSVAAAAAASWLRWEGAVAEEMSPSSGEGEREEGGVSSGSCAFGEEERWGGRD